MEPGTGRCRIASLEAVEHAELFDVFRDAFSDYVVPVDPTPERFAQMLDVRGASLSDSFGAYAGDELVAFAFNALDRERGLAYDVATGVRVGFRGRGLAARLMRTSAEHLARSGCRRYRLEVLEENHVARRLYERAGFLERRVLVGYTLERPPEARPAPEGLAWAALQETHLPELVAWLGYEPSWQNALPSLRRGARHFTGLCALVEGRPVGGALVHAGTRDVPCLGVDPEWRRRGIGRALLLEALRHAGEAAVAARFANLVPGPGDPGIVWLERLGARRVWRQLELERPLGQPLE